MAMLHSFQRYIEADHGLRVNSIDSLGTFTEALQNGDSMRLTAFPKANRHCHSLLSATLTSIQDWAGMPIKPPPVRMASLDEMRRYTQNELFPIIFKRGGFEFTGERTILEAIQDGVYILEMSIGVDLIKLYESGTRDFFDFIQNMISKYDRYIRFQPEIGLSKSKLPTPQIKLAREFIDTGLFKSIDLYGNEHGQDPEVYSSIYKYAASRGLKLKAHVGEFGGPELIERTLRVLNLNEIQHGISATTSKSVINLLKKEGIRLNVCPSSNVALSIVKELACHPISSLIENEVRVSINTDNETIFGKNVSDEYLCLYQAGIVSAEHLEKIRTDSLLD